MEDIQFTGKFFVVTSILFFILITPLFFIAFDFWAGTRKAKQRGERIVSDGWQRTVRKIARYYNALLALVVVDAMQMASIWYLQEFYGKAYQTPSDRTIVVKIPFGKAYDIVASARAGFETPKKLSFTASQAVRNVSVVYKKISLGVFILGTDGSLYSAKEWNQPSSSAVGVAVLTNECKFVIAPSDSGNGLLWSKGGVSHSVPGVTTTTNPSVAKTDYKGVSNSSAIVSIYGVGTAYAAGWCQNFSFKNGKKGYLGSCGEWAVAYDNKAEINACMLLIGGTEIENSFYWTSSQHSSNGAWMLFWRDSQLNAGLKNVGRYVRAFAAL